MSKHCGTCRDSINGMPHRCDSRVCLSTNMGLWREPLKIEAESLPDPIDNGICGTCINGPDMSRCKADCTDYSGFLATTSPFAKKDPEGKTFDSPLPIKGDTTEPEEDPMAGIAEEVNKLITPEDSVCTYKFDGDKTDMSLLMELPLALEEVCKVMMFGEKKYERGSFVKIPNGRKRYTAALLRHLFKEGHEPGGEVRTDSEIGLKHDVMVAVNALFRLEMRLQGL